MERDDFEARIRELVRPLNGQYPRPWMTDLTDPRQAEVFIVGYNQKEPVPEGDGRYERHVDALFNRPPGACREWYNKWTDEQPSDTRKNTDDLVRRFERVDVGNILQTNVICYSTPDKKTLRDPKHAGGAERGEKIFRFLLESIDIRALIVHGASARKKLQSVLGGCDLPTPPTGPEDGLSSCRNGEMLILTIRSLAKPEWNKWYRWAPDHLTRVAEKVADHLRG